MLHVVNFSGGLCSFWAAHRIISKIGTDKVVLLFADVMIEDEDLYEFNRQASALLQVPTTRVCFGLTPWQLFRKEGLIGNSRIPLCSIRLKREPLDKWHRENCDPADTVIYVGFDWTEQHRLDDLRVKRPDWNFEAPMISEPIWDKCRMVSEAEKIGLLIPRAYRLGFPHNNCGMRCVQAGLSHWAHLLETFPEKFAEWEKEEHDTIVELSRRGIKWMTMLKDRRGGTTQNLTLCTLRLRIEAGEKFTKMDWGGCGCGVQV